MCSMANLDRNMALSDRTVARIHQDACVGEVLQSDCLQRGWLVYCRQTKDSDLWPSIPCLPRGLCILNRSFAAKMESSYLDIKVQI